MSQRRPSSPHGRRALVASGVTAALVLVPVGMARAAPETPDNPVTEAFDDATAETPVVSDLPLDPGTEEPEVTDPEGTDPEGTESEGTESEGTESEGTESEGDGTLPPFEVPAELQALFAQAGFSEECIEGVSAGLEQFGAGLAALLDLEEYAAELEAFLTELSEADPAALPVLIEDLLTGFVPSEGEAGPSEDIIGGLELVLASLETCVPTLPSGEEPEPEMSPVAHPTPEQPAPHAPQPVAQPVAYLGYAPTGADAPRADDTSVPLTALGGGLVLVAAGAAGYGMRGRAVRTRD
ncbi:hypothetical protein [Blastococcus goldschmidtiae]|uniref:LPXTG-motif cell wall anchor domain-containing protein n=1 Tax=Blastococcus goldschmidtiae TaxID=3075546 RepID=A0ABU2KBD3_9ACTN|nr:hypothetical protein [Blastococcus sp. DSM 46792]MDT0277494.1 hypothetical protein [Blastococcus sp. DSM 46792]